MILLAWPGIMKASRHSNTHLTDGQFLEPEFHIAELVSKAFHTKFFKVKKKKHFNLEPKKKKKRKKNEW